MTETPDFQRPKGWDKLSGRPPRRWPTLTPPPTPPVQASSQQQSTSSAGQAPLLNNPSAIAKWLSTFLRVLLAILVTIVLISISVALRTPRPSSESPWEPPTPTPTGSWSPLPTKQPTSTPSPQPVDGEVPVIWQAAAVELHQGQPLATFIQNVDGSFETGHVIDAGPVWVTMTARSDQGLNTAVHGLDVETGELLWTLERRQAYCATVLMGDALVCAGATSTDPATGLGTTWRIDLVDPTTGEVRQTTSFDGWLTMILVADQRIVLLEQRLPAPHAVVSALDANLQPAWSLDLTGVGEHDRMFSSNRIISRSLPLPQGPALDRPRIRTVADGLTALWIGNATAFIDVAKRELKALPRCSRLVDDGERLWCNAGDLTVAYSYDLEELYSTDLGVRLAFPDRDPRGGDVTDPIFLNRDGVATHVDLTTGQTLGTLIDTVNGEAFGQVLSPFFHYVDGVTYTEIDDYYVVAFDARTGELLWDSPIEYFGEIWAGTQGQLVVVHSSDITILDAYSGHHWAQQDQRLGLYTVYVGDVLAATGPEVVARLVGP